jgi:tetratricopeptide (TPR) repeat protein
MAKIKKASNMNQAYLIYLTEKKQYGTQPSFFLDIADYFIAKKETKRGLRILSNIAELELENHSLLRVLANKLLQLKQYSIALQLFKDLIELRPEEPQSYRDLGLAYEAMGNYNEAIKQLYQVVKEPFDNRFYGIELIAMNEINAILSKNPEGVHIDYIDKKLLKNMPVDIRVVLNWDADNTDVDLWVTDPNGEKCYYSNNLTRAGGRISNDFTQGYGPEEFMIRRAKPGYYKIEAHYYGTTTQSIQGKATLSVQFFKQFGTRHEQKEEITRRLNVTDEVIYLGTFKF